MRPREIDLDVMLRQVRLIRRIGNVGRIVKMVPGLAKAIPQDQVDGLDDKATKRVEAILLSMTPSERSNPNIIDGSRR